MEINFRTYYRGKFLQWKVSHTDMCMLWCPVYFDFHKVGRHNLEQIMGKWYQFSYFIQKAIWVVQK